MMSELALPNAVMASVIDRTEKYLASELGITVTQVSEAVGPVDLLQLRDFTAIVGVGDHVGLIIAFSFSRDFVDILYNRLAAGINVPSGDEALYRGSAVTEIANIIVGHCTADFSADGEPVSISPPILLDEAKHIHRKKSSMFSSVSLVTTHGVFDINLVGPRNLFDMRLDHVNEVPQWNG